MKTCTRCSNIKPDAEFRKKSASKDGLSAWCKTCFKTYDAVRYQNGDAERIRRNHQAQIVRNQDKLWNILVTSSCLVCGNDDPEVLEFDHRDPNSKFADIASMLKGYSWKRIQEEIDKCDILCANHHRKRTIKQFGTWRGKRLTPTV